MESFEPTIVNEDTLLQFLWNRLSFGTSYDVCEKKIRSEVNAEMGQPDQGISFQEIMNRLITKQVPQLVVLSPDSDFLDGRARQALVDTQSRQIFKECLKTNHHRIYNSLWNDGLMNKPLQELAKMSQHRLSVQIPDPMMCSAVTEGDPKTPSEMLLSYKRATNEINELKKELEKVRRGKPSRFKACGFCQAEGKTAKACRSLAKHCLRCSTREAGQRLPWPCNICAARRQAQAVGGQAAPQGQHGQAHGAVGGQAYGQPPPRLQQTARPFVPQPGGPAVPQPGAARPVVPQPGGQTGRGQ